MGATLRIEIFPSDIDRAVAFYAALGFEVVGRKEGPPRYASIRRDDVRIGMVQSPRQPRESRTVPIGTEIVVVVDDVRAERDREWGLTDFRVHDPDGYYLRITDRR
ncbi:MAG: VOC family protein [Janibacter sp.]